MTDTHQMSSVPSTEELPERLEESFDAKRSELGVDDGLIKVPGVTTLMLVAFNERGIKSVEDLADCATDDLVGWSELKDGITVVHAGILSRFKVSCKECEAIIINARIKAGWIK